MVHLGLGNFHRAHQAWYTADAPDAAEWGIAAFTGRRPDTANDLAPQDGLYTLITRGADGDTFRVLGPITAVHPADDHEAYLNYLGRPEVAIVTITVTEAGYLRGADGRLDTGREVVAGDVAALQRDRSARRSRRCRPSWWRDSWPAAAGAGPITSCPATTCRTTARSPRQWSAISPAQSTTASRQARGHGRHAQDTVDRLTPATTDDDRTWWPPLRLCGRVPGGHRAVQRMGGVRGISEWATGLAGRGRPVVDDVTPYEQRKLWLLNGSHSLLAYAGSFVPGPSTRHADPDCRGWVESFWNEASPYLTLPVDSIVDYREALLERYSNARIGYRLARSRPTAPSSCRYGSCRPCSPNGRPAGCRSVCHRHRRVGSAPARPGRSDQGRGRRTGPGRGRRRRSRPATAGVLNTMHAGLGDDSELVDFVVQQCERLADRA